MSYKWRPETRILAQVELEYSEAIWSSRVAGMSLSCFQLVTAVYCKCNYIEFLIVVFFSWNTLTPKFVLSRPTGSLQEKHWRLATTREARIRPLSGAGAVTIKAPVAP
jgi:hypothetical protein